MKVQATSGTAEDLLAMGNISHIVCDNYCSADPMLSIPPQTREPLMQILHPKSPDMELQCKYFA